MLNLGNSNYTSLKRFLSGDCTCKIDFPALFFKYFLTRFTSFKIDGTAVCLSFVVNMMRFGNFVIIIIMFNLSAYFSFMIIMRCYVLVVYRSSETSTNQSDVIIRSDDRFLNLVVDSDSKIYMLNFVLWLFFFFCLHTDKNIAVLSQLVFFALIVTNIW